VRTFAPTPADALPQLDGRLGRATVLAGSDSLPILSHGFDALNGTCNPRGWTAEDRSAVVFAHVSDRYLANRAVGTSVRLDDVGAENGRLRAPMREVNDIAVSDLGSVFFVDDQSGRSVHEGFPALDSVRTYVDLPFSTFSHRIAFDPLTGDLISGRRSGAFNSALYRTPRAAGEGTETQIAGGGLFPGDTTADRVALGEIQDIVVDAQGNIYFCEKGQNVVRMLRQNDQRIVTLLGTGGTADSPDGVLARTADVSAPHALALDGGTLYVSESGRDRVRTVDLVTGILGSVPGFPFPSVPVRHLTVSGGALWVSGPEAIWKYESGALTRVVGTDDPSPFRPESEADLGTNYVFDNDRETDGLAPDGAGGIYFSDPHRALLLRLRADLTIEVVAGEALPVRMGARALWFGADEVSAPAEVAGWVHPRGFGSGWSQRLVSPPVDLAAHPDAVLSFDAWVEMGRFVEGNTGDAVSALVGTPFFLAVQVLGADGRWALVNARCYSPNSVYSPGFGDGSQIGTAFLGKATAHFVVEMNDHENDLIPLASPTRFRVVVQTRQFESNEDGLEPEGAGAAIVDNLRLRDGTTDLIAPVDFEDGTLGGWTLSALNGSVEPVFTPIIRDLPVVETQPALRKNFDFADPTCVWTFLSPGDTLRPGVFVRMRSPWIAAPASAESLLVVLSTKLATQDQARVLQVNARFKQTGGTRPVQHEFLGNVISGVTGSDLASPFIPGLVLTYPPDPGAAPWREGPRALFEPLPGDSIQIEIRLLDLAEQLGVVVDSRPQSRLPYLDDVRVLALSTDPDGDGVPADRDGCPAVSAAGQDADGDGCPDPTSTLRHVETWTDAKRPIRWALNHDGDPRIGDGSDLQAVRDAAAAWLAAPGASVPLNEEAGTTPLANADALDGVNLVTWKDDVTFPPDVLAVTPTTSFTKPGAFDDRIVLPGEIVDSDLIFNPRVVYRTSGTGAIPNSVDLESVAAHELGHLLGLSHSGVPSATMFPVLQSGDGAASLEADDHAAIGAAYPGAGFASLGTIAGAVTRGQTGLPIPGALVTAAPIVSGLPGVAVSSDYTDETGAYALRGLAPGSYAVRIAPLDGSIPGLVPQAINARVSASAQTNFIAEYHSAPETNRDDPALFAPVAVGPGGLVAGVDVITTVDTIPPAIASVLPSDGTTNVAIDGTILVNFSEPVAAATISAAFSFRVAGETGRLGGSGQLLAGGRTFVFTPENPLQFGTEYEVELTTALTDREAVPLAAPFVARFTTLATPSLAIAGILPRQGPPETWVTILGSGFTNYPGSFTGSYTLEAVVTTSGGAVATYVTSVTPTSVVVRVPSNAVSGPIVIRDYVSGDQSNPFHFTVVPEATGLPVATGPPIPLLFAPTDVVVSPEGHNLFAAGAGGFATINLSPTRPSFGVPVPLALRGGAKLALTPDGARLYVSRPDSSDVVEVVADTAQAGFGQSFTVIPTGRSPDGLGLSADGRTLYATERGGDAILEIDVDPTSATFRTVRREMALPGIALTGGIVTHPFGAVFVTSNLGVLIVEPATFDGDYEVELSSPTTRSVTLSPDSYFLHAIGTTAFGTKLVGTCRSECSQPPNVSFGGRVRDLVQPAGGSQVFAINSELNQIQVVERYAGTIVGDVPTGVTPVAAALSGDGAILAVANAGSRSIGLYAIGDAQALLRVGADPVLPGEVTTITGTVPPIFSAPAVSVTIAGLTVSPLAYDQGTAAFEVPALEPVETSVALTQNDSPSRALPVSVFDPIPGFAPRATGLELFSSSCAPSFGILPTPVMQVSPNGKHLMVPRHTQECSAEFDLYEIGARGSEGFGNLIRAGVGLGGSNLELRDVAYSREGGRLWAAYPDVGLVDIDVDPDSKGFGSGGTFFGSGAHAVVADPLANRMIALNEIGPVFAVCAWNYARTLVDSLQLPGPHHALAISPDGRWIVAGGVDRARIVDARTFTLVATTPAHGFLQPMERVAVTADGARAVGLFAGGDLAVWSLEAGSVGAELYFGPGLPGGVRSIVPGTTSRSLVAGCVGCSDLRHLDLSVNPPVITATPLGQRSVALARAQGGRHLWVADEGPGTNPADIRLFSLSPAARLDLISGGGQQAVPPDAFALPIRVRLAHPDGAAAAGVAVRFTPSAPGGNVDGQAGGAVTRITDVDGEAAVSWVPPPALGVVSLTVEALGTGLAPLVVVGEVVESDEAAAPQLVALGPADGAVGISTGTEVFARFNQRMDPNTTHDYLALKVGGVRVPVTHRYEADGRLVLLRPATPFPFTASCTLEVSPGASDLQGQTLAAGGRTSFTTQNEPALAIALISPPAAPVGAAATIQGGGFSPVPSQNIVRFNGVVAPVLTATATSLVAQVPATALTGPLTVQIGTATSNALEFVVLASPPESTAVIDTLPARKGVFAIAVTPDGARAYVTNATSNTVAALDVRAANLLATIPVGVDPRAIALLPDGSRAYVANTGSNDVSVISTDPLDGAYHTVVARIPVKAEPVALAVSSIGPRVLVVERGSSTMSVIDAQKGNATFDLVTDNIDLGSGGVDIMISPDGGRAFIATSSGFVVVDLESYVTDNVDLGSGGTDIMISPDGGLLFVLTEDGRMVVVAVAPGAPARVVDSVDLGSGGTDVMISPDGGRLYVTVGDGDEVLVFDLKTSAETGGDNSSSLPGPPVTLTLVATIPVGDVPVNMAADPLGRYVLVVNQGSGEITVLGVPAAPPPPPSDPVVIGLEMSPNHLNLSSMGKWINVKLTVPPPYAASQIDLASVRFNGVVPLDLGGPANASGNTLTAKVRRSAIGMLVPADSTRLEVVATGAMADTHFAASAVITVKRGKVTAPHGNEFVHGATTYTVRYEKSPGPTKWVALLHSFDGGTSWIVDGTRLANTGSIAWNVPDVTADSALIAVVEVEDDSDPAGTVVGVLGMSSSFTILGTVGVGDAPAELSLARVAPNPSSGPVAMRFGLPRRAKVSLEVFDVQGRLVRTLVDEERAAGWHDARWDGRHRDRGITGAGIYFVRLRAEGRTMQQRVVRLE
jgi:YVTN family beta-propeller protein